MPTIDVLKPVGLFLIALVWCAVLCQSDWRHRRLSNAWTLGGALVVLVFRLGYDGIPFFLDGFFAAVLAGLFLFIPFLMHGAGGGDVKMLFACGTLVGMGRVLDLMVYTAVAGVLVAVVLVVAGRVDPARLKHGVRCLFDWTYDRKAGEAALPSRESERVRIPFSLAIASGLMLTLLMGRWL